MARYRRQSGGIHMQEVDKNRIRDVFNEKLKQCAAAHLSSGKRLTAAARATLKTVDSPAVMIFFALVAAATIYIATIGALGIYYDTDLLPTSKLINHLLNGDISTSQYLSALKTFTPHISLYPSFGLRFQPLYEVDFKILMYIFDSPSILWLYRGASFALLNFALYRITAKLAGNRFIAVLLIAFVLFPHAGYWYVWTTLTATCEGQASVAIALCLLFYFLYLKQPHTLLLVASMLFAAIALGYKEVTFPALGTFASIHFLLALRKNNRSEMIASLSIIGIVAVATACYYFYSIATFRSEGYAAYIVSNLHSGQSFDFSLFLRTLRISIATDPILVFLTVPLFCLQLWQALRNRALDERQRLVTAMLAAGSAWIATLLVLGLANEHFQYFGVPGYCFAIPGIAGKVMDIIRGIATTPRAARVGAAVTTIGVALSLAPFGLPGQPTALKFLIDNRVDFQNWAKVIDKSYMIIRNNRPNRTYFYFYKSPRSSTIELYKSFTVLLVARGALPKDFDLTYASPKDIAWNQFVVGQAYASPKTPWSWPRNWRSRPIKAGDYMIVNSWWPFLSRHDIDDVLADYDLVYGTSGLYGCKPFSFGPALKYILHRAANEIGELWYGLGGRVTSIASATPLKQACSPLTDRRNFYIFRKR